MVEGRDNEFGDGSPNMSSFIPNQILNTIFFVGKAVGKGRVTKHMFEVCCPGNSQKI